MIITVAVADTKVETMYTLRQRLAELGDFDLANLESRQPTEGEVADYFMPADKLAHSGNMPQIYDDWSRVVVPRIIVASGVITDDIENTETSIAGPGQ